MRLIEFSYGGHGGHATLIDFGDDETNALHNGTKFYVSQHSTSLWFIPHIIDDGDNGDIGMILPNITDLVIDMERYVTDIRKCFPNVKKLWLRGYYNKIERNIFPDKIETLDLRYTDNEMEIDTGVLPETLRTIKFDDLYNQPLKIDMFPNSLKKIYFGEWFNQKIDEHVLPENLTHLKLNILYNKKLYPNILPPSLTHLSFTIYHDPEYLDEIGTPNFVNWGESFPENAADIHKERKEIVDILPNNIVLEELCLDYGFNKSLRKKLNNVKIIKYNLCGVKRECEMNYFKNIDFSVFTYNNKIYIDDIDYSEQIYVRLYISDTLPMPIADEILYEFEMVKLQY